MINSEEEFAHNFLLQEYVHTFVVEDKSNNITDLVCYILPYYVDQTPAIANITTVVSTQSPVKQLIIDALVCARENCGVTIHQYNIESDILASVISTIWISNISFP